MGDRNYIVGIGIQGNKVWLMYYNVWLYIYIGFNNLFNISLKIKE